MTQAAIGALVGEKSKQTIANYEAGRRSPDPSTLRKLAAALGVTVDWILTGDEPSGDGAPPVAAPENDEPSGPESMPTAARMTNTQLRRLGLVRFPVLTVEASAGPGYEVTVDAFDTDSAFVMSESEARARYGMSAERIQIMPVRGTSMRPTLQPGDLAVVGRVSPGTPLRDGAVYVLLSPDGLQIKRLAFESETIGPNEITRFMWIKSDDTGTPDYRVPAAVFERDYHVIAILLDVIKPL